MLIGSGAATGGTGGAVTVSVGSGTSGAGGAASVLAGRSTIRTGGSLVLMSGEGTQTSSGSVGDSQRERRRGRRERDARVQLGHIEDGQQRALMLAWVIGRWARRSDQLDGRLGHIGAGVVRGGGQEHGDGRQHRGGRRRRHDRRAAI